MERSYGRNGTAPAFVMLRRSTLQTDWHWPTAGLIKEILTSDSQAGVQTAPWSYLVTMVGLKR